MYPIHFSKSITGIAVRIQFKGTRFLFQIIFLKSNSKL